MDRSITPRISQLPQSQASPHRTPTSKHDALLPEAEAGELSKAAASPGLLSWMRAALQLGPAGQSAQQQQQLQQQQQQQSRTDIASTPSSLPTIVDSPPSSAGTGTGTVSSRGSSSRRIHRRTSLQSAASRPRSSVSRDSQYSLYDDSEASDEDDSADEETFAPFAPAPTSPAAAAAAGPPALVRPMARRDAAFVRESSDGSLDDGQVLLDGAPAPAGRAALPPSASAQRISFGAAATAVVGGNELKVHEAQEDGQFVRDTTASAPSLVLTPPDEGSLEQQTSPLAGWVESDRFEPTPTPSSAHRAGRRVSIASTASGLTEREEEEAAAAATNERGDGETLDEFTQRPRSPAEMNKERQSREKVVLGTRGASLREQAGQQEARRARREQRRVEKEKEQMEVLAPVEAEWDESRSKTPKAFSPATMGTPRTASASTAAAGETTPLQTSKRNEPATPITASSALDVQTTTPTLNAPSPRRARLSFFGRKREASISSLLAPGSSPEHSRPSSSAATSSSANETDEDEAGRANATPVAAAAAAGRRTESESSAVHSQSYDAPPASAPAHAHTKAQSSGGAGGGAGFWRLGRSTSVSKRRGEAARPATASSSSLSTSFAHAQRSGAENLSVSSDATSSRRNSLANTDDAHSMRSSTSRTRPRPLSNAGSIDGAQSLKSAKLKAASSRKEKVPLPLEAPRAQKVRARNKPSKARDFGRLFLVQELQLGANSPQGGVGVGGGEARRDSLPARQSSEVGGQAPKPPPLLHSDSTSSITSNVSSVASSTRASVTSASSASTAPPPSATGSTFASSSTAAGGVAGTSATYAKRRATWAMKFSVDGKYLAVAGQDAVVRVYQVLDSAVARAREVTQARARYETAAAQANEGLFPASGGRGGGSTSSLGSAAGTGSAPNSMRGKPSTTGTAGAAASSPLPNLSVFASEPVREFRGHTNDVLDLSWSKGGFLLSASMDKTARLWHLSSPTSLVSFVHGDFVTSACFHPRDDRFMLTGSLDGKLRLWNIPGKRVQYSQEIPGLITACSFTQSGATACVGTFAGAALFYSTDGLAYSSSIAVRSPSGKNAKGGRKITGIEPLASDGAAGERVLITSNDSRIRAYNLRDKSMSARWKAGKTYINRTSQIRASVADDGTYVVSGSECGNEGGLVHVWDVGQQAGDARSPSAAFKAGKAGLTQADSVCEYWTAAAGTVTCAIMAPLKTNAILRDADDPILMHAAMRNAGRVSSSTTQALSAMSLASAFSAAVPNSLKSGSSASDIGPGFHPRECRIIASVDESAVVRIWRQDTHGAIP